MDQTAIRYKRSRFSTRLPSDLLYSPSHYWIGREVAGVWQVGFTKFATRMLGEMVELDFEVEAGEAIETGQTVGWVEGFKAVTDLFSPLDGTFCGANAQLEDAVDLVGRDPYRRGWLYRVQGRPDDDWLDVRGYMTLLDQSIDKMLGKT